MLTAASYPTTVDPGAGCPSWSSRHDPVSSRRSAPSGRDRHPRRGRARGATAAGIRPAALIADGRRGQRRPIEPAEQPRRSGGPGAAAPAALARSPWSSLTTSMAAGRLRSRRRPRLVDERHEQLVGRPPAGMADDQPDATRSPRMPALGRPVEDELDLDRRRDDRPQPADRARPAARRRACATGRGAGSSRRRAVGRCRSTGRAGGSTPRQSYARPGARLRSGA